jgi:UDP-N-acetylmuramoylalanine--D-glutamate ligase
MRFSATGFYDAMAGKTIDVIGLGISNTALVFRLAKAGAAVTLRDRREEEMFPQELTERLRKADVALCLGNDYLNNLDGEIIFRTPGMNYLHPALVAACSNGQAVTSELEVFLELCPCPIVGITGSDGKTTTTSLIAAMLERSCPNVHLGGNIGVPLLPILDSVCADDICVVEMSSFQLISMRCSPDVAVVTNLRPNHLDVHRDMEEYTEAKRNIVAHQSAFSRTVLSADCPGAAAFAPSVRGKLVWFSRLSPVERGAWMDEKGDLWYSEGGKSTFVINRRDVKLLGLHNIENLLAAISAVWGIVPTENIAGVASSFIGVEHRIEPVRERNGVRWINDSIATSPSRTVAGLMSFDQKLIVIAGGYDKHLPFEPLVVPLLEHCKILILTGATADRIEDAVRSHGDFVSSGLLILRSPTLKDAVHLADSVAAKGDIVTLSPACASFDSFENFEKRGEYFKSVVNSL